MTTTAAIAWLPSDQTDRSIDGRSRGGPPGWSGTEGSGAWQCTAKAAGPGLYEGARAVGIMRRGGVEGIARSPMTVLRSSRARAVGAACCCASLLVRRSTDPHTLPQQAGPMALDSPQQAGGRDSSGGSAPNRSRLQAFIARAALRLVRVGGVPWSAHGPRHASNDHPYTRPPLATAAEPGGPRAAAESFGRRRRRAAAGADTASTSTTKIDAATAAQKESIPTPHCTADFGSDFWFGFYIWLYIWPGLALRQKHG